MSDNIGVDFDDYDEESSTELAHAIIIDLDDNGMPELHYFPKSQCTVYKKKRRLYAPEWLLTKKGLL